MHGSLRIAVAELSLNEKNNQSLGDHGFRERVVSRRYCLLLSGADSFLNAAKLNSGSIGYSPVSSGK